MTAFFGTGGQIVINTVGAGEGFIASEVPLGLTSVSSGASGDIFTLTPPSGKRVILDFLYSSATETGITITVGGVDIISGLDLAAPSSNLAAGQFKVGNVSIGSSQGGDSNIPSIITENSNDTIVLTKDAGSTGSIITFSYRYGN